MPVNPDTPTLADEIAAVRAVIADMNAVKPHCRMPRYERTLLAMHAVLYRLIAVQTEGC